MEILNRIKIYATTFSLVNLTSCSSHIMNKHNMHNEERQQDKIKDFLNPNPINQRMYGYIINLTDKIFDKEHLKTLKEVYTKKFPDKIKSKTVFPGNYYEAINNSINQYSFYKGETKIDPEEIQIYQSLYKNQDYLNFTFTTDITEFIDKNNYAFGIFLVLKFAPNLIENLAFINILSESEEFKCNLIKIVEKTIEVTWDKKSDKSKLETERKSLMESIIQKINKDCTNQKEDIKESKASDMTSQVASSEFRDQYDPNEFEIGNSLTPGKKVEEGPLARQSKFLEYLKKPVKPKSEEKRTYSIEDIKTMSRSKLNRCLSDRGLSLSAKGKALKVLDDHGKTVLSTHPKHKGSANITFEPGIKHLLNQSPEKKEEPTMPEQSFKKNKTETTIPEQSLKKKNHNKKKRR